MPELRDLEIDEVSLVPKPANRRKFLLFKSAHGGDPLMELDEEGREAFEDALNTKIDNEDDLMAALEKLAKGAKAKPSDQTRNAIRGALRLLKAAETDLPAELLQQLSAVAKTGYPAEPVAKKGGVTKEGDVDDKTPKAKSNDAESKPEKKPEVEVPEEVMTVAKAAGPDEGAAILETYRSNPAAAMAWLSVVKAQGTEVAGLRKDVADMKDAEDSREVETLRKEIDFPGDAEAQRAFIKGLTREQRDALKASIVEPARETLKQATEGLTSELGRTTREPAPSDAYAKIQKLAKALIEKGDGELSYADAEAKVLESHPELYAAYNQEKGWGPGAAAPTTREGGDD